MSFVSIPFLLFALLFFAFWPLAKRNTQVRLLYIVAFSLLFYGWWDWRYVFLLLATGLTDFMAALLMERYPRRRKPLLWLSIGSNLGCLGYFKYANFFLSQVEVAAAAMGRPFDIYLDVVLPLGISFYTFQSMSYTIDVYRGELRASRNPLQFLAYLALFPQLVAGPIVRASTLLPQMAMPTPDVTARVLWTGLAEIALGFFKKLVIADNLGPLVSALWASPPADAGFLYWMAVGGLFGLQIYADFSGYSSIAIGLARCMGYHFDTNFNRPYAARGIADFWSRWHISLSSWLRDYVYIPLGGNRNGRLAGLRNLWITMLVSGIWHGANYTFLVWAAIHATMQTLERSLGWAGVDYRDKRWNWAWRVAVMTGVAYGWIWFRAPDFSAAVSATSGMFHSLWGGLPALSAKLGGKEYVALAAWIFVDFVRLSPERDLAERQDFPVTAFGALVISTLATTAIFLRGVGDAFIYFQF
jgi:alginate O-acetyltransferase complex protein AlgI